MLNRVLGSPVGDEETAVKARSLTLLALVTAVLAVAYVLVLWIGAPDQLTGGAVGGLLAAFALSVGCFWLARRGRVRLSAAILFAGLFATICLYMTEPANTISDLTMAPFLYILVVLPAGYILHPGVSFVATTLGAIYTVTFILIAQPAAYVGFAHKSSFWSNVGLAFALCYILSAIAWVFGEGVTRALDRTRQQNRRLRQLTEELAAQRRLQAETGRRILDLAERLTVASKRQASGSNRQAAAVAQVSTSIGELEQAAKEIAQNARQVDEAARETLQNAQEGQAVIWRNNEAMGLISANAQKGVREAEELARHLKQVDRVAAIMSKIADQIQLVAFNATLEAAEAGAAGQRFGVVAAEMKDLAADSLKQAKQVARIVQQLQEAGEAVVSLSGEQVRVVQAGAEAVGRSGAAHQAIIASAERLAHLAAQIQQATAQQQQASEQVADSVQEIKAVADRWVVSSYQMDEMVNALQSLAEQLV